MTRPTTPDPAPDSPRPYTLRCPHTHAGALWPAGTTLDLYPDQIERVRAGEDALLTPTTLEMTDHG